MKSLKKYKIKIIKRRKKQKNGEKIQWNNSG